MYKPPEVVDAQDFVGFANAATARVWPPESKRLRVAAHSDFHSEPFQFVVNWSQIPYYPLQGNGKPFATVSVSLPIMKPVAPGSMRVQLMEVSQNETTDSNLKTVGYGSSETAPVQASQIYGGSNKWEVETRGLAEGPFSEKGNQLDYVFAAHTVYPKIEKVDTANTQFYVNYSCANETIDPSQVHHPKAIINGTQFTFDILSRGGHDTSQYSGTNERNFQATFVVFPDPYWSKN